MRNASLERARFGASIQSRSSNDRNASNTTMLNAGTDASTSIEFARCFLRLANLPNFALDRLSRYEANLWRQAGRILYALETLDRRKPQERTRLHLFSSITRQHNSILEKQT